MNLTRISRIAAALAVSTLILAIGIAPSWSRAADHLDAPGPNSPGGRSDADINDVYVFRAADPSRTVIAVTTHPAVGVLSSPDYASNVRYKINIDRSGDAVEDLAYVFDFSAPRGGTQAYTVTRYTGKNARTLAHGNVRGRGMRGEVTKLKGHGLAFAGKRSDPFFFDLGAFLGAVAGPPTTGPLTGLGTGRTFCDQNTAHTKGIDFFDSLNTNAIVIEVPSDQLAEAADRERDGDREGDSEDNSQIGVWATTIGPSGQIDRMGIPALNTVFNKGAAKNAYNAGKPSTDRANFETGFIHRLQELSALNTHLGPYDDATAKTIVELLLPDMLSYNVGTVAAGPLNGRGLADDVIDVELNIVTRGAVPSDCVDAHTDLLGSFPYLGNPH